VVPQAPPRTRKPGKGKWRAEWARPLGLENCPYVIRWLAETPWFSLRMHHWLGPDDARAFHDHAWWFITFVVKGGYSDVNPKGCDILQAPAIRFRPALHRHTVQPLEGGAWTIMLTGRIMRPWGYWKNGVKFVKNNKWFASMGHHPCES
jgi:hypothetical protein